MADLSTPAAAPAQVQILAKHTLLPASPTPRHPFFLPSLDILWQDIHYNRRILFYRRPQLGPASDDLPFLQHLQHSLSLCLVHYYPWCGRIAKDADPPHRLFIDCNETGVEFFEASIDMPLSLLAQDGFQMKPFFEQLCQQPDHKGDCLFSSPLLTIQATLFSDGGLALGVSHSHMVADGHSLWNFMISWAECSRGVPLSLPPLHDRQRLALPNPSLEKASHWKLVPFPLKEEDRVEEELEPASVSKEEDKGSVETEGSANGDGRSTVESSYSAADSDPGSDVETIALHDDPLVQYAFDLPSSAIKELKSESGGGFTSYEVICAHFWQRTTVAQQAPKQNLTYFTVLANFGSRLIPPLPPAYFGNVISFGILYSTAGKISNEALHKTASRIHELIVKVQDESESFMHYLETHDNRVLPELGDLPDATGHNVASSPRFPVYQVDFGWDKPVAVRPAKAGGSGEIILFGGRPGATGDIEICTVLPATVLKRLLEDPVFLAKPTSSRCAIDEM